MCNPESQMEPNGVSAVGYLLRNLLKLACLVLWLCSYGLLGWFAYNRGRADFHNELLQELDAKGGAPILLYGPDKEVGQ